MHMSFQRLVLSLPPSVRFPRQIVLSICNMPKQLICLTLVINSLNIIVQLNAKYDYSFSYTNGTHELENKSVLYCTVGKASNNIAQQRAMSRC